MSVPGLSHPSLYRGTATAAATTGGAQARATAESWWSGAASGAALWRWRCFSRHRRPQDEAGLSPAARPLLRPFSGSFSGGRLRVVATHRGACSLRSLGLPYSVGSAPRLSRSPLHGRVVRSDAGQLSREWGDRLLPRHRRHSACLLAWPEEAPYYRRALLAGGSCFLPPEPPSRERTRSHRFDGDPFPTSSGPRSAPALRGPSGRSASPAFARDRLHFACAVVSLGFGMGLF